MNDSLTCMIIDEAVLRDAGLEIIPAILPSKSLYMALCQYFALVGMNEVR